ncbi:MAG: family 20 glycosylhydrolase [Acidobacteriota bacterium]|nr:family 20 glycosylhydrolase [Acidobacteriota bacterium]
MIAALTVCPLMAGEPALMPAPAKLTPGEGRLAIDAGFGVTVTGADDGRVRAAADRLTARLSVLTGAKIGGSGARKLVIHCAGVGAPVQKLGEDEGYMLDVSSAGAKLEAANPLGALHGMETFLQLAASGAPAVHIEDRPRFPWRGLHLDVSRHWIPADVVKRNLDAMAAVKLNVFHWHLSDDQGFRVESKRYPKLQGMGSDGNYYTQDQIRDVIAYARNRGIRVVPEFDIPGHSTSWLVGYPELASSPGPYEIERRWGVFDPTMDPTRETTYTFLDGFIGEMSRLFPDEFFHIGGDEVNGKQWKASVHIQAFMKQRGLKDNHELQAHFNQRVQAIVKKYGKRMEGWDEILNGDLPKNIVIQSWRGQKSLAEAARMGYAGILSSGWYLDHMLPASTHYAVDPMAKESDSLNPEERSRILGGEAAEWAEYATAENVDNRIWPRTAAIAERLWSPAQVTDVASMYRRLEAVSRELETLGLTHRSGEKKMLEHLAGAGPLGPLQVLADVVEPVKMYVRNRGHKYTQQTPLNRVVDAVPPESDRAREFAEAVDRSDRAEARRWLTTWRDNDARLQPVIQKSPLLGEITPLSQDLSRVGRIGIEALDAIESGKRPPEAWVTEQRAFLQEAKKARAELLLMVAAPVEKLLAQAAAK